MPTTFKISPSVQAAALTLKNITNVSAVDFAIEILENHTEYANQGGSAALSALNNFKRESSQNISSSGAAQKASPDFNAQYWIAAVGELFNDSVIKELHGRVMIIGLCLLDKDVRNVLVRDDFIFVLIKEIKENIISILDVGGLKLYNETLVPLDETGITDFVNSQGDGPLTNKNDDKLDRYNFAGFLVKLLNNTEIKGAYSLHLYAPWGAGKTTVMNFIKGIMVPDPTKSKDEKPADKKPPWYVVYFKVMNFMKRIMAPKKSRKEKPLWYVVDFNAWQNQSLAYPWWTLMNCVYLKVRKHLSFWRRRKEWWWRFNASKLHYLIALVAIVWLIVLVIIPAFKSTEKLLPKSTKDSIENRLPAGVAVKDVSDSQNKGTTNAVKEVLDNIDKIIAVLISAWAFVAGLSRSIFLGSKKTAQNYVDSQEDPLNKFKSHFEALVNAISPSHIAIFIDDLDRCKSPYVVELLESIQTLFKGANVVFIISADKKWIHACYEVEYEKIKKFVGVEGKTIGPLFVEKMFQLSVSLPGIANEVKEKLWESMIGIKDEKKKLGKDAVAEIRNVSSVPAREKYLAEANSKKNFAENHAIRLEILNCLADKTTLRKTEYFLKPYSSFLDMNPRSMKRLLNSYSVNKASSLVSHIDIPLHQLILWTIILMRWPSLAEYLMEHPDVIINNQNLGKKIPKNVKALLEDEEVKDVLMSKDIGERLSSDTLKKCRELFM